MKINTNFKIRAFMSLSLSLYLFLSLRTLVAELTGGGKKKQNKRRRLRLYREMAGLYPWRCSLVL